MTKLDLSQAWDGAIRRLAANRELVLVLGGIFFFLPQLAFALFTPAAIGAETAPSDSITPQQVVEALNGYFSSYWWAILLSSLIQIVGTVAVLNVLGATDRPTVGQAVERGAKALPTMLLTQILASIAALIPMAVAYGMLASGSLAVIGSTLILPATAVTFYLFIKFSLTSPVIALEETRSPIEALSRSWQLTRRNSFRLFAFYALLLIGFFVVFMVMTLIVGLVLTAGGSTIEVIGNAVFGSLVNAAFAIVTYSVLAAVYRQLSGGYDGPSVPKAG